MTGFTSLTAVYILVVEVGNRADGSVAVRFNVSQLARRESEERVAVLLSHQLSHIARGANHLTALAGVKLDVVDNGTYGDILKRERVAGLDVRVCACSYGIADLKSIGSDDISLLAVLVLNESDESGTVGVVLKGKNRRVHSALISLEVDNAVFFSVAAADVANGNSAVAVSACGLLNRLQKTFFGSDLGQPAVIGNSHTSAAVIDRLVNFYSHFVSLLTQIIPSKNSIVLEPSARVTIAFFQSEV